ncbi:MAG: cell envelope integrity protein TolA [Pseudomonadales bacterium]|nr:cell envelope integrity protein TolA [Pseudomonadales bacterium]MCP5215314.1 cell envelope integrity protein TolA [Pseudomonadales bacterium]
MSKFSENSYILPTLQAVLLHTVILIMFLSSWNVAKELENTPIPRIVKAQIINVDPTAARKKEEQEKNRIAAQREAEKRRLEEAKRKQEQAKQKAVEAKKKLEQKRTEELKKKAEQKKKEEQKLKAERERKQQEADQLAAKKKKEQELAQLERKRELEIARALDAESEYLQYQTESEEAMAYVGLIQERVVQNWHRPLSARNDMQVLLMIHLVPTGEVHKVYVLKSSGDAAFDRSAIQAVQRAGKFEELRNLSPRVFDAKFRQFRMLFKPEDLIR